MSGVLLMSVAIIAGIGLDLLNRSYAKKSLKNWAKNNDYRIIQQQCPLFDRRSFFLQRSKYQIVYQVTVIDRVGTTQYGWACCGNRWGCIFADRVEVTWQD